jgi:hypothetical protein
LAAGRLRRFAEAMRQFPVAAYTTETWPSLGHRGGVIRSL